MAKRYQPSAGNVPQFISGSFTATNRKARVTGKRISSAHNLINSEYESQTHKGHLNNKAYVAECECAPSGIPSQKTLELAANVYLYASLQVAGNKNSRDFHDNRANWCPGCNMLRSRNNRCQCNDSDDMPVMPFIAKRGKNKR